MGEVRVVRATGDPLARGRRIGRELAEPILRSLAFYRGYFERRGVSSARLQDLLTPYLVLAEQRYPEALAVLKGMSLGATAPVLELFAINVFEELEALLEFPENGAGVLQANDAHGRAPTTRLVERCSSLTVSAEGATLLAHNENWLAGDLGNVAVVVDHPDDGSPPVASPTIVACLPAVGMNGHGGVQGIDSLTAADDGVGLPRVLVSRSSLEARNRADAVARAAVPDRAGGYGHVFAFSGGDAFTIETTGREHRVLDGPGPHTNHYLDPDLASIAPAASDGSAARYARLTALLEQRKPRTPEALMDIMRDHGSGAQSICLHPDPQQGDDASAVLFSMVCDVEAGRMWVAAGNPCRSPYEEIDLADVGSR